MSIHNQQITFVAISSKDCVEYRLKYPLIVLMQTKSFKKFWCTQNKIQLKLQAAMEGTSHPAPPTGGFRKTGNGEQYAFKIANIEGYVKVI